MRILYLIPARKGSKGLPGKNVKVLQGKPLISYSIEFAQSVMRNGDRLFVSTNDDEVIQIASRMNVNVPIKRPEHLSSDEANSFDVIMHAVCHFRSLGEEYDAVMLLQPTSPLRSDLDYRNVLAAFDARCDMVATVKISKENPYFNLFEESDSGFLNKSKKGNFSRRQDCPEVFAFNGSMYLIKVSSLEKGSLGAFAMIRKVIMPEERSVDIDTNADWILAEHYVSILYKNENS